LNISLLIFLFTILAIAFLVFWILKRKERKYKFTILAVPLFLAIAYGCTYIPHKVVSLDPSNVSRIAVFDGNTGYSIEITDAKDIDHIISNLNKVTFQKGESAFGYMGYSFSTTIFDENGERLEEFIINSNDTIRYNGFFYTSKDQFIDYDYIAKLVRK
jgi:hypothetical protein